jgi:hypothetical protein
MTRLPRRHFFNLRNEIRWNKEKRMGGTEYRVLQPHEIAAFTRGEESTRQTVQDSIDSLNAAIDRLDQIIKDMTKTVEGEK